MCELCQETPGWIQAENGVRPCKCRKRHPQQTQLNFEQTLAVAAAATEGADELGAMGNYPWDRDEGARKAVADALEKMCSTVEQVRFVVGRALLLHTDWNRCGIPGLRQILIGKYAPRDGIEDGFLDLTEARFPDGLPSERDNLTGYQAAAAIAPPPTPRTESNRLLPAGSNVVSIASAITPELARKFTPAEPAGDLPLPKSKACDNRLFRAAVEAAKPKPKPITQADIEAALQTRRNGNS